MGIRSDVKLKFRNITYRWIINFISIIAIILIVTNLIFFVAMKKYFYKYAEQTLKINAEEHFKTISSDMKKNDQSLKYTLKYHIENFSDSYNTILLGLNFCGDIIYSSSKFNIEKQLFFKDCILKTLKNNSFIKISQIKNKEHIITYTLKIPITNNDISAVMYITSLNKIDNVIKTIMIITSILSFIILFLVIISGVFFIKYFVEPIKEVNVVIKKIADGNLKYRIKKNYHYEIKNLSDSINFMAEELSTSENLKNEFISSISHELRTPLTAIKGWSETIMNTKYEDKDITTKGLTVISKEVKRLSNMVEDLLDFSKIQGGHFTLKKEKMDIFAELEEAIIIYSDVATKQGKFIEYEEDQNIIPIIFGDKNRVRQVFINIIDNAIKYSNTGGKITIKANIFEDMATIIVKDNGCGIEKKDLPQITKKFFKANMSKKGSGIGLSVVKEIVDMHFGSLKFSSTPKNGTTVTISFPLMKDNSGG